MASEPRSGGDGAVALVTGASSGIGLAVAREIASFHGAVVLVARSGERLDRAALDLGQKGRTAHAVATDLTRTEEIERLARFVEERLRRLDTLVHAAGAYGSGPLADGIADELMAVNYRAATELTIRLLPLLKASAGQTVFINSTQGLQAGRNVGAYAATKFALRAFADSLRAEVNRDGVRVLSVFAGSTATPMQERIHRASGRPYEPDRLVQPADIAAVVGSALRVPRTAEVTELTIRPMRPPVASG